MGDKFLALSILEYVKLHLLNSVELIPEGYWSWGCWRLRLYLQGRIWRCFDLLSENVPFMTRVLLISHHATVDFPFIFNWFFFVSISYKSCFREHYYICHSLSNKTFTTQLLRTSILNVPFSIPFFCTVWWEKWSCLVADRYMIREHLVLSCNNLDYISTSFFFSLKNIFWCKLKVHR